MIELRYGLSDGKEYTFKEIANDLAKSDARISQMTMYVRSKFLEKDKRNEIFSCIHKPSEKFIRAYFNKNDVFEMDNQQLSDDDKEELMNILNEEKKKKNVVPKEEVKTDEQKVLDMEIQELEFSARTTAALKRKGWNFVGDLAEKKLKDFNDTRGLGKKGIDEIIEKLRKLGIIIKPKDKKKDIDEIEEDSLENLNLSTRSYNAIRKRGICTITELLDRVKSKEDLEKMENIGEVHANEIIEKIGEVYIRSEEQEEKITEKNNAENEERVRRALSELRGQREKMQELDEKIAELKKQRELYREQTAKGLEGEDEDGR